MNQPVPTIEFASEDDELKYLLRLAEVEMSLLGESAGRLAHTMSMPLPTQQCFDLLPWKRGRTVVADFGKLGKHCARIAELLAKSAAKEKDA